MPVAEPARLQRSDLPPPGGVGISPVYRQRAEPCEDIQLREKRMITHAPPPYPNTFQNMRYIRSNSPCGAIYHPGAHDTPVGLNRF